MKYKVGPTEKSKLVLEAKVGRELREVVVDAADRWDAVVKAVEKWGVSKVLKMQEFFDGVSVKKVERKKTREWRAE